MITRAGAMKKDYIPVAHAELAQPESAFLESHWTSIWTTAQSASKRSDVERRDEYQLLEPLLAALQPGSRILDGGCGLGEWTLYCASRGLDTIGLDVCKATVEGLKNAFPDCTFMTGDIRSTDFPDDYFDLYFSWGTFEHFENGLGDALEEARRILRSGGHLAVSVPFQNGRHLRRDTGHMALRDENRDGTAESRSAMRFYQWRLTKPELQRELDIRGFRTLTVEPIHKQHGLRRAIKHDLHTNPNSRTGRVLQALLGPLVPDDYVAHMILGIARKE
jgi:SAM-dependent methyltransferase